MTNHHLNTLINYLREDIADTRLLIQQLEDEGAPAVRVMTEQDRLCSHEKKLSNLLETL